MISGIRKTGIKVFLSLIFICAIILVYVNTEILINFKLNLVDNLFSNTIQSKSKLYYDNRTKDYGPINRNDYSIVLDFEKIDWVNYSFVKYEANRTGPGEQGKGVTLTDPEDIKKNEEVAKIEGLNAVISDKISVNRSLCDTRPEKCKGKLYLKNLPNVSVIMIFHNEYESILHRSIHSIYNRTPHKLLHEIILVNDKSTRDYLYEPLEKYIIENFHGKVRMIVLPERSGLIRARMEGARVATGEILVFVDAHVEANVNWLPPLIEPIALDPLIATVPVIDYFHGEDFKYDSGGKGGRGIFDWSFIYKWLPRKKGVPLEENTEYPIMLGCIFAINRQYYWDLGAYDEELMIWNGENYELSFKLWLCGGKLLEVPCSRIAHTFRKHNEYRKQEGVDFVGRNFKRIAEVWLDNYKELLYKTDPQRFAKVDPGNLTIPKMIKEKLKCKPFKYYLEYVAPDMLERYPVHPHTDFAYGAIVSKADTNLCIDTLQKPLNEPLGLFSCHDNNTNPGPTQFFNLTYNRNIKSFNTDHCLDAYNMGLFDCHYAISGNQFWRYFPDTYRLIPGDNNNDNCLTAILENKTLTVQPCEQDNIRQKWDWGFVNQTALKNWCTFGIEMEGECK